MFYDQFVANAQVELIQGDAVIYGPLITNAEGKCDFADIATENYLVKITRVLNSQGIITSPLILKHYVDVGPGANSTNLTI